MIDILHQFTRAFHFSISLFTITTVLLFFPLNANNLEFSAHMSFSQSEYTIFNVLSQQRKSIFSAKALWQKTYSQPQFQLLPYLKLPKINYRKKCSMQSMNAQFINVTSAIKICYMFS